MRLRQLIFQGVGDQSSPGRLKFGGEFGRALLPGGLSMSDTRALLIALLYPGEESEQELELLEEGPSPKLALIVEAGSETIRIVRGRSVDSVRLQGRKAGDWQTIVDGHSKTTSFLDNRLGRPSIRLFRALNLWDFEGAARESAPVVDPEEIGPEAVEMVEEYRRTLELDELESELARLDDEIEKLRDKYGKGLDVERRLEQATSQLETIDLSALDEDDLEVLEDKESRLSEYREKLEQLTRDEREARERVARMEPEPPWRHRELWAGLAIGVVAVATSLLSSSLRWVVLVDTIGFGLVAWTLLEYLTDREQVNIHKVRVESVKRRSTEVRREMIEFREHADHLLVHAGADNEQQLLHRHQKAEQLREVVDNLEQKAEKLAGNEKFQKARRRLEKLETKRQKLQDRREELPEYGADLFRLENELQALGVDPKDVERAYRGEDDEDEERSPFELLVELAEDLGYRKSGALDAKTAKLWHKMTRHILGNDFQDVKVGEDGQLEIEQFGEADDLDRWLVRHPDESRLIAGTLALSLHLRAADRDRRVETVWLEDPDDRYPAALAEGLKDVLKGATKRADFALVAPA